MQVLILGQMLLLDGMCLTCSLFDRVEISCGGGMTQKTLSSCFPNPVDCLPGSESSKDEVAACHC
jgi:hypothetical protein